MADEGFVFNPILASDLKSRPKLTTGVHELDVSLNGGLPTQGIVEISGESGSGKTQLCLQLSLTAQHPMTDGGLHGSVAYICTEDSFPIKRLQQLISAFHLRFGSNRIDYGNNVFIEHVPDFECLKECLSKRIKTLISNRNLKLLIIDSVAALFRGTYSKSDGSRRTQDLRILASLLHELNFSFDVCIVSINQVTANISQDGCLVAALGLAWSNMVTTRMQLSKMSGPIRRLRVIFSPACPRIDTLFLITGNGIESVTQYT